jgi:hypothetical protein
VIKLLYIAFLLQLAFFSIGQSDLNEKINVSQLDAMSRYYSEPIQDSKEDITAQKEFRVEYLNTIDSLIQLYSNDTLLLTESYLNICASCPANVTIHISNLLISFKYNYIENKYIQIIDPKNNIIKCEEYFDLDRIRYEIRNNSTWNLDYKKYATEEDCFDGGRWSHTVIYPTQEIKSVWLVGCPIIER